MEQVFGIASIVTVPNAISVAKPNATPPWFLSGFIVVFIHVFLHGKLFLLAVGVGFKYRRLDYRVVLLIAWDRSL